MHLRNLSREIERWRVSVSSVSGKRCLCKWVCSDTAVKRLRKREPKIIKRSLSDSYRPHVANWSQYWQAVGISQSTGNKKEDGNEEEHEKKDKERLAFLVLGQTMS